MSFVRPRQDKDVISVDTDKGIHQVQAHSSDEAPQNRGLGGNERTTLGFRQGGGTPVAGLGGGGDIG